MLCFFFQAEDGIRYLVRSRGLGDVYKRQHHTLATWSAPLVDVGTLQGNIAIISHQKSIPEYAAQPSVAISNLVVKGEKLNYFPQQVFGAVYFCLLYTSDAADERSSVDLGGRRIIKKKKKINKTRYQANSIHKDHVNSRYTLLFYSIIFINSSYTSNTYRPKVL